jgi:hypothetical protein
MRDRAGDHFTPREVIALMVDILFSTPYDVLTWRSPRLQRAQRHHPHQGPARRERDTAAAGPEQLLAPVLGQSDLQNEFVSAVIGAMESHSDLSTQIINNSELKQKLLGELVPLIYNRLKATA